MTDKEKRLRALLEPSDYFKGMGTIRREQKVPDEICSTTLLPDNSKE